MPGIRAKRDKKLPGSEQTFQYWVEVLELKNESVRILPLNAVAEILIPRKKSEAQKPTAEILQLKDGSATLEARSLGAVATQFRERNSDEAHERILRRKRDREAEERRANAVNMLVETLAEAVVKKAAEVDNVRKRRPAMAFARHVQYYLVVSRPLKVGVRIKHVDRPNCLPAPVGDVRLAAVTWKSCSPAPTILDVQARR